MSLAKKMFLPAGVQIPCVNLPFDVSLDDVMPWAADIKTASKMVNDQKVPAFLVFVENSKQLEGLLTELSACWEEKINFWVFYPKKPHLNTDLSRDVTWKVMKQRGMSGTRQVAISDHWSCMYFKNTGNEVMPDKA